VKSPSLWPVMRWSGGGSVSLDSDILYDVWSIGHVGIPSGKYLEFDLMSVRSSTGHVASTK